MSNRSSNPGISCATDGHLWNGLGYCVMCRAVRPDWECSECGEPCNASVPHTCYADYRAIKAELNRLRARAASRCAHIRRKPRPDSMGWQCADCGTYLNG